VQFGLVLPIQAQGVELGQLWKELRAETAAAEAAGFDAVFLPEFHQARGGALISPLLLGAGLIQGTQRIRFGTAVLAAPLHHPVRVAEDLLMLDWISAGRAILGLGIGHLPQDFAAFGVPHGQRGAVFQEFIEVLEACLRGRPFVHAGTHFRVQASITPEPCTRPRPPIWIGAHGAAGLARAARHADRWLSDPQRDIPTIARLARQYRDECRAAGRTARIGLFRECWIGDSRAECERVWGAHALAVHRLYYNVGTYHREFEPWVDEARDRARFTFALLARERFLFGSGSDIVADVRRWSQLTGADYYAVRMRHPGGPSHAAVIEAIARFGAEVVAPLAQTA
jgi:alkanesulfonate monooxygenase SsuD/methylene tetrahydromethanopterin reductase-like flavin-dependent oxidoreductase (luciferase family)